MSRRDFKSRRLGTQRDNDNVGHQHRFVAEFRSQSHQHLPLQTQLYPEAILGA